VARTSASSRIWYIPFSGDRRDLLPLFRLADDSEQQIRSYLDLGDVFAAFEVGQVLGHAQLIERDGSAFELKSIAVLPSRQRQGIGGGLLDAALGYCHAHDAALLRVSTAISDCEALGFYLRHGFRAVAIVRDAFTSEGGYSQRTGDPRIRLNDAIELELAVRPNR